MVDQVSETLNNKELNFTVLGFSAFIYHILIVVVIEVLINILPPLKHGSIIVYFVNGLELMEISIDWEGHSEL